MNKFETETLLKIRREFTEKEKYDILMKDYFDLCKKIVNYKEIENKYLKIKEQHKNLQSKYTKLKNSIK
jgi:hypothetical protein